MARALLLLTLVAVRAAAQTVEHSVFDAATGAGAGGVKVELLKGGTPLMKPPRMAGDASVSTMCGRAISRSRRPACPPLKDRKKEIGRDLLAKMCADLKIDPHDL